jgi:hypothetical protein
MGIPLLQVDRPAFKSRASEHRWSIFFSRVESGEAQYNTSYNSVQARKMLLYTTPSGGSHPDRASSHSHARFRKTEYPGLQYPLGTVFHNVHMMDCDSVQVMARQSSSMHTGAVKPPSASRVTSPGRQSCPHWPRRMKHISLLGQHRRRLERGPYLG